MQSLNWKKHELGLDVLFAATRWCQVLFESYALFVKLCGEAECEVDLWFYS